MYSWHDKEYIGGAHGLAGILYLLLQVCFKIMIIKKLYIRYILRIMLYYEVLCVVNLAIIFYTNILKYVSNYHFILKCIKLYSNFQSLF
jgi:hypothetical protein